MGSNHRPTRRIPLCLSLCLTAMLLLVLLSPLLPLPRAVAQQPDGLLYASDYQEDEATGWSLQSSQDGAWVVDAGALNGYGHVWAVYEKGFHWGESGIYTYRIRFAYLEGGLNVNLQVGETGRYAIELQDMDGRLHVGLLREYPSREFVEVIAPRDTGYALTDRPDGFAVEVRAGENRIEVTLEGHDHNPALTFKEPDPLPPGTLAFETYENSATQITKVEVWGPAQQPAALPDLAIADAAWRHDADSGLIELDLRVRNLGKGESGPTGVYAELMPAEIGITEPLPALGPGQDTELVIQFELPQNLLGEAVTVFIDLDPEQRVVESNEENNATELRGRVAAPEPTATPQLPTATPVPPPPPTPRPDDRDEGFRIPPLVLIAGGVVGAVGLVAIGILIRALRARKVQPEPEPGRGPEEVRPVAAPVPPVRLLRIWLSEGATGTGAVLGDGQALQAGALYTLHLQVQQRGAQDQGPIASDAAARQHLRVVLFSPETDFRFSRETVSLTIPTRGSGNQIGYPVRAQQAGHRRLRACIYHGNVLLQSAVLEADVADSGQAQQAASAISRVTDYVASSDLGQPEGLTQPTLSIFTNRGSDGTHWIGLFAEGERTPEALQKGMVHTFGARELASMAGRLRSLLTEIQGRSRYNYAEPGSVPDEARVDRLERDLAKLAQGGHDLYNALFFSRLGAAERADALLDFDKLLRDPGIIAVARCRAESTTIPWAALYGHHLDANTDLQLCGVFKEQLLTGSTLLDQPTACRAQAGCPLRADIGDTVCPLGFWGFLHEVEQPLQQVTPTSVDEVPPQLVGGAYRQAATIDLVPGDDLRIVIAYYPRLPAVGQHLSELQTLGNSCGAQIQTEDRRAEIVGTMLRQGGFHLGYFYCHAEAQDNVVRLKLGPADQPGTIAAADLDPRWRLNWRGKPHPLIVLNACETVAMVPERVGELMLQLRFLGSSGVIGTEIEVRTELASEVGARLMKAMLDRRSVGEAFTGLRLGLLAEGNPLGLAYTLHAPAGLHIHTPSDCAWCRTHIQGHVPGPAA